MGDEIEDGRPVEDGKPVDEGGKGPDDGKPDGKEVLGCTDPTALNYDPLATVDDNSCLYGPDSKSKGCTDPTALNYDPTAQVDDGSCIYKPDPKPQPSKTPKVNLDLRGVVGNMQAEPRVFAHDAIPINVSDFGDLLMPPPDFGERTFNRGCCIYAGVESNIQVQMESGRLCTFKRVAPGSFLPILVIKVISAQRINEDGGFSNVSDGDLVSLW